MTYRDWIMKHRETSVEKYTKVYSVVNENKEVRVHNIGDQIFIRFLIDGQEIEKPEFPPEVVTRFRNYLSDFYCHCITKELLVRLTDTIAREFLPHLKNPRQVNFNNWKLEITMEEKA